MNFELNDPTGSSLPSNGDSAHSPDSHRLPRDFGHCLDNGVPDFITPGCDAPGLPTECICCVVGTCIITPFGTSRCCGGAVCLDVTGVGEVRLGGCFPPSCTQDADCGGYRCVGGTCCGTCG